MIEQFVKKVMCAGLGALMFTREKIEEVVRDMVQGGQLTREQGKKILDELVTRGERGQEEFTTHMQEELSRWWAKLQFVGRDEFTALQTRVDALERQCRAAHADPAADLEAAE